MIETTKIVPKSIILAAIAATFVLVLSGCADDPSPVGSFLLPASDLIGVDTLTVIAGGTSGEKAIPFPFTGFRTTFALGKTADGFEAWTFLYFFGFPDSLKDATFQSAEIRLQKVYYLVDSTAALSLSVHKALGAWNRDSYVFDSLSTPGIFNPSGSDPINYFEDRDSVRFGIDTALVREWVRAESDTTYKNFGLVLGPKPGSNMWGFQSAASDSAAERPMLTIRYTMSGSSQENIFVLAVALDKFVAGMADTTFLGDSTLIPARGGAAYRGLIGFDFSPVPAHSAVHRAFMDLTFDSTSSLLTSNQEPSLHALYGGVLNPVQPGEPISAGSRVYRFNVTEFVQAMVAGVGDSRIRLSVANETNTISLFMMHGSAATDPVLQPRVTVLYSPPR